jgi:tight adherence protein C
VISAALGFAAAGLAVTGIASIHAGRQPQASAGFARRLAAAVPARLKPPLDLAARLEAAGSPGNLSPKEFMAIKALTGLIAVPPGVAFSAVAPGRLGPVALALTPVAGFLAPDLHLRRRATARIRATRAELPGLLDLLRVAIDAGMAPSQALTVVGHRSEALLGREWERVGDQVQLGVPLAAALNAMTRRLPAPELQAFAAALGRAMVHGAPLSATLAAQARDARLARRRRVEEEAAKAAPKIQLVVALLLVPSVLLMVAAALAAAMLGAVASH